MERRTDAGQGRTSARLGSLLHGWASCPPALHQPCPGNACTQSLFIAPRWPGVSLQRPGQQHLQHHWPLSRYMNSPLKRNTAALPSPLVCKPRHPPPFPWQEQEHTYQSKTHSSCVLRSTLTTAPSALLSTLTGQGLHPMTRVHQKYQHLQMKFILLLELLLLLLLLL